MSYRLPTALAVTLALGSACVKDPPQPAQTPAQTPAQGNTPVKAQPEPAPPPRPPAPPAEPSGPLAAPLAIGDEAPRFEVALATGGTFQLADAIMDGPVVLVFYRGHW